MALSVVGRIYARITGAGLAIDDWFAIFAAVRIPKYPVYSPTC
jgi:hypothetical protein